MKTFPQPVLYMNRDDVEPKIIQISTRYVVFIEITLIFFLFFFFYRKGSQEMLETNFQQLLNFHPSHEWFMDLSSRSRPIPTSIATSMSSRPAPVLMHLGVRPGNESTLLNNEYHQTQQPHQHSDIVARPPSSASSTS
jgi:hypothetical protein